MGKNAFKMVNAIASNQRLCRLLKYQTRNPFSADLEDVAGEDLINKQILIAPKLFDENNERYTKEIKSSKNISSNQSDLDEMQKDLEEMQKDLEGLL